MQSKAIDLPEKPHLGVPTDEEVNEVLQAIKDAKFPVLLAGMRSSSEKKQKQFVNLLKNKLTCCRNFPRCWCN